MSAFKGSVKSSSGGDGEYVVELPEADTHPAVVCALVDLGTHAKRKYQSDEVEDVRLVLIGYQLADRKTDGTPHVLMQEMRLSYHTKSTLYATACKLLKKKPAEGESIDYAALVGLPASVTVSHGTTAKGKSFARIDDVGGLGRGMTPPKPDKTVCWSRGDDPSLLEWLPYHFGKPVAEWVELCVENTGSRAAQANGGGKPAVPNHHNDIKDMDEVF